MPPVSSPVLISEAKSRGVGGGNGNRRSTANRALLFLIGILIVLPLLQFFVPLRTAIKIGADEDWELSKATLSLNGYHFYTEVWNDQPLLHTWIITKLVKHVSPSVLGPRLVTSAFA